MNLITQWLRRYRAYRTRALEDQSSAFTVSSADLDESDQSLRNIWRIAGLLSTLPVSFWWLVWAAEPGRVPTLLVILTLASASCLAIFSIATKRPPQGQLQQLLQALGCLVLLSAVVLLIGAILFVVSLARLGADMAPLA